MPAPPGVLSPTTLLRAVRSFLETPVESLIKESAVSHTAEVVLSFAHDQRACALRIRAGLLALGFLTALDERATFDLWNETPACYVDRIYGLRDRFVVVFLTAAYLRSVSERPGASVALTRAIAEHGQRVLVLRFDETPVIALSGATPVIDARAFEDTELRILVLQTIAYIQGASFPRPELTITSDAVGETTNSR